MNEKIKRYLDKVIGYLVEDTIIDYDKKMIRYPSPVHSVSFLLLTFHYTDLSPFTFIPTLPPSSPFSKFIKGNYGLTNDEIDYVWEEYKNIIIDKINSGGSINESVENKEKYLDKIVQYILEDTEIDYEQKLVTYPFIPNTPSQWGLSVPLHYVQYGSPFFKEYSKYCNDIYGLSYEESIYVWDRYVNISGLY